MTVVFSVFVLFDFFSWLHLCIDGVVLCHLKSASQIQIMLTYKINPIRLHGKQLWWYFLGFMNVLSCAVPKNFKTNHISLEQIQMAPYRNNRRNNPDCKRCWNCQCFQLQLTPPVFKAPKSVKLKSKRQYSGGFQNVYASARLVNLPLHFIFSSKAP